MTTREHSIIHPFVLPQKESLFCSSITSKRSMDTQQSSNIGPQASSGPRILPPTATVWLQCILYEAHENTYFSKRLERFRSHLSWCCWPSSSSSSGVVWTCLTGPERHRQRLLARAEWASCRVVLTSDCSHRRKKYASHTSSETAPVAHCSSEVRYTHILLYHVHTYV